MRMKKVLTLGLVCQLLLVNLIQGNEVELMDPINREAEQDADEKVTLQLPDGSLQDVLKTYEVLSGVKVISSANLPYDLRFNIVVSQPILKQDALDLIQSVLMFNGFALIPGEESTAAVEFRGGANPRSHGLPVYASPEDLDHAPAIITYFMKFNYMNAVIARTIFGQQVAVNAPYGAIVAVPNVDGLLITENTEVIRKLIDIKKLIDVPPLELVTEFVELKSADAEKVAKSITDMISLSTQPGSGGSAIAGITLRSTNGNKPQSGNVIKEYTQLIPDSRTNRILVVAKPENLDYFRGLISYFDEAPSINKPYERHLQYVPAGEVLPLLENALAEQSGEVKRAEKATPLAGGPQIQGGIGSDKGIPDLESPQESLEATSVTIGKTRIIADNRSNVILIMGPPESVDIADEIMNLVDKPPRQVYLAVVIGELDVTDNEDFGIDVLQRFRGGPAFGAGSSSRIIGSEKFSTLDPRGPTLSPLTTTPATSVFPSVLTGLTAFGMAGNTIDFFLHALESTERFHIISRPSIYTSNNKRAVILSGSDEPFAGRVLTDLTGAEGSTAQRALNANIEFKEILLKLAVVPLINSKNEVTLNIFQANDTLGGTRTIADTVVPVVNRQELETSVTVANRDVVVLGGLIQERDENNVRRTPVLSKIPLLGKLFRSYVTIKRRKELIVLIQPVVIEGHKHAVEHTLEERSRLDLNCDLESFIVQPEYERCDPCVAQQKITRNKRKRKAHNF